MPKFYRQNRKKIDPRYFLNETINRDEDLEEAISSKFDGEMDAMRRIRPGKDMMSDKSYADGYNSIAGPEIPIEDIKDEITAKIDYLLGRGMMDNDLFAAAGALTSALMAGEITDEKDIRDLHAADKDTPGGEAHPDLERKILDLEQKYNLKQLNLPIRRDSDRDGTSDSDELMQIARSMKDQQGND
tara:strand:+ start:3018 stop:3578 length:561 start_codon:yes stop_codon:yes gene_type:complete